jgi:hypothetical protein
MSNRFDNRSIDTFKQQIKFSTMLENYFFFKWIENCNSKRISVKNPRNNGVDNTGEFVEKGKTSGADYIVDLKYNSCPINDMPIEIKWVPTYGKLTLKVGDLKAYIREKAAILFIYPSEKINLDLKIPKDYDLDKHISKIESIKDKLRWGIMTPVTVKDFFDYAIKNNMIQPIHYMGGKPGVVLNQSVFSEWFEEELWVNKEGL